MLLDIAKCPWGVKSLPCENYHSRVTPKTSAFAAVGKGLRSHTSVWRFQEERERQWSALRLPESRAGQRTSGAACREQSGKQAWLWWDLIVAVQLCLCTLPILLFPTWLVFVLFWFAGFIFGFSVILFLFLHCTADVVFLSVAHLAPRGRSTPVRG